MYQNSLHLSSFDTLILIRVLIQTARLLFFDCFRDDAIVSKTFVFETNLLLLDRAEKTSDLPLGSKVQASPWLCYPSFLRTL
jgi:hypothetical protein